MSEQLLVDDLDQAIDAILAGGESVTFVTNEPSLSDLVSLSTDLRGLPRQTFKLELREKLIRSSTMPTTGAASQQSQRHIPVGYHSITPYLTVERAEELVDFVKQAFGAVEVFRTTGSAGGLHAEVLVGDSKLMIGGMKGVEE